MKTTEERSALSSANLCAHRDIESGKNEFSKSMENVKSCLVERQKSASQPSSEPFQITYKWNALKMYQQRK